MRILIVEDEKKLCDLIDRALKAERFAVDVATDGNQGWQLADSYDYDLIILDLMLPGIGGRRYCAASAAKTNRCRCRRTRYPWMAFRAL
jgi:DNA-binding response OmpR family regulator